jgi:cobalt-zinc-cadmium efflux system membrane fusion protein
VRPPAWVALACAVACAACHRRTEPKGEAARVAPAAMDGGEAHADEPGHDELARHVRLEPDVIEDAGIKYQAAAREPLAVPIELPGELVADPDRSAQVSARIAGRVEKVLFREGQEVKPELGEVSSSYASLTARAASARSNADRLGALLKSGLASEQEAIAARAEAESLESQARAATDRLRSLGAGPATQSRLELRAPIGGTIVSRAATVGQPVTPSETIASIVDLREVWFLGRVFEQNLARIHVGAHAEVQLNAYPAEVFAGAVDYIAPRIDPVARTVMARVRLTNMNDRLRLGLFGTARVDTGDVQGAERVLVVSRSSVTQIGKKPFVFVREPDGDFDAHEVVLARSAPGKVEVISGLREGELVVYDGVFTLKSALLKRTFAEE